MISTEMRSDIIQGLCTILGNLLDSIILYGSFARNQATEESDIDIAIILNGNLNSELRDLFLAWASDMDLKYDRVFSVVDISKENMSKWENVLPYYKNVREEGIVLWKAA